MLSAAFYSKNRDKLKRSLPDEALIIISANSLVQRSGDTTFPFRQDSTFYYFTGVVEPELVLVINGSEEFFILPKRTQTETIFGGKINCNEIAKISGCMTIYSHTEGWSRYKKLQQSRKKAYTIQPHSKKVSGIDSYYVNPQRHSLIQKIKRIGRSVEIVDISKNIISFREVKSSTEVVVIQEAINVTKKGFLQAKKTIDSGGYEHDIEAEFDYVFKKKQAVHGYQPIVANGANACVLHYVKNQHKLDKNKLTLLDVGAEYHGYNADISRTYSSVDGASSRQNDVVQSVKRVHENAINYLKVGQSWKEFSQYVEQCMSEQLLLLGLISEPTREQIRRYFPHAISHSLGLDVHDPCDYTKPIRENMVITVEPGIYIPEEDIGVRIEDNIVLTKNGAQNLSVDIPY